MDDDCTPAKAKVAASRLLALVKDFPFTTEAHKSGWLAMLLTPFARPAIHGPVPLFVIDANTPGTGKGLLFELISGIVLGAKPTVIPQSRNEEEQRKQLTSMLIAAPEIALYDNITGVFGSGTLDAMLTSTSWSDRLLGLNRTITVDVRTILCVTANNIQFMNPDTARRAVHIRLQTNEERPDQRQDFVIKDLGAYVIQHRFELANDVLTILRAYHLAGRPKSELPSWGSFSAWSDIIRGAITWLGLPDPGETRELLRESASEEDDQLSLLIAGWEQLCLADGQPIRDSAYRGLSVASALDILSADKDKLNNSTLRQALAELFKTNPGQLPAVTTVSYRMRGLKSKVRDRRRLERGRLADGTRVWFVDRLDGPPPEDDLHERLMAQI